MSLNNSLITKLRESSLTVNEQSCLRGRYRRLFPVDIDNLLAHLCSQRHSRSILDCIHTCNSWPA